MKAFLEEVAEEVYLTGKDNLDEFLLVSPGRRVSLYLKHYLAQRIENPVWSPEFSTISEWMLKLSGYQVSHPIHLVFRLYKIYGNLVQSAESFDEFYSFGEILINDFNDLDKNLVNASDLFRNLTSLKQLESHFDYLTEDQIKAIRQYWDHFKASRDSEDKTKFLSLWNIILPLYDSFRSECKATGQVYEGMAYRKVGEEIDTFEDLISSYSNIYLIGFNALTRGEKRLFDFLKKSGKAVFFWDSDVNYTNDPVHEAGFFMRENLTRYPEPGDTISHNHIDSGFRSIEVQAAPTDPAQVQLMSQCLSGWHKAGFVDKNNTAVVLGDETLLTTVIRAVPPEFNDINITMGQPIKNSPAYHFVLNLLELQKNRTTSATGSIRFYYQDVLNILNHQFVASLKQKEYADLRERILKENLIYPTQKSLKVDSLTNLIFQESNQPGELSAYLGEVLRWFYTREENEEFSQSLHKEFIYYILLSINRLNDLLLQETAVMDLTTYQKLLIKVFSEVSIPFSGEPLRGLQIMGVLETRALDFENLIILSMNEGVFPAVGIMHSAIPYNLRRGFGLPSIEHRDRIYAYYFYRLIQRAKRITLIWCARDSGLKKGEMSRYIYQLKYLYKLPVKERSLNFTLKRNSVHDIIIPKGEEEIDVILKKLSGESYLSPSALNTWLQCSLQFYFKYVLKLREPDQVSEVVDSRIFGSILHETLKELYLPFAGTMEVVTRQMFQAVLKNTKLLKSTLIKNFKNIWFHIKEGRASQRDLTGMNLIIADVLYRYLHQTISMDSYMAPLQFISLETSYIRHLTIGVNDHEKFLRLGGIIDRIDYREGVTRILDYKTGDVSKSFRSVESLFEAGSHLRNKEAFQTLMYCWLYEPVNTNMPLMPGLYNIRSMHTQSFHPEFKMNKDPFRDFLPVRDEFEYGLKNLLSDLLNREKPFVQTKNIKICKYCYFKEMCHRD